MFWSLCLLTHSATTLYWALRTFDIWLLSGSVESHSETCGQESFWRRWRVFMRIIYVVNTSNFGWICVGTHFTCLLIVYLYIDQSSILPIMSTYYWLNLNVKSNLTCIHDFLVPIQPKAFQLWQDIKGFKFLGFKRIITSPQRANIAQKNSQIKNSRYL